MDTRFQCDFDDEAEVEDGEEEAPERGDEDDAMCPPPHKKKLSELSSKKLDRIKSNIEKSGIVYMSRIPPFMKPAKVKQILSVHAEIGRIYLAPEDTGARARRKKMGGNSGKKFTEGWVEFLDKRKAKAVALMLNGQPIGGKKRSAYHFDLWNLKYLSKFKWDHLTEEIAYQKAVREQKLALELSAGKKERDFYLKQVDQAKAVAAMADRRLKKAETAGGAGGGQELAKAAKAAKKGGPLSPSAAEPAGQGRTSGGGPDGGPNSGSAGGAQRQRSYMQRQVRTERRTADTPVSSKLVSGLFGGPRPKPSTLKRKAAEMGD